MSEHEHEHLNFDPGYLPPPDPDPEPLDDSADLAGEAQLPTVHAPTHPVGLFGAVGPVGVITKATEIATALKDVLKRQGLISNIQGREYPRCEAWTLLGTMLGVFPVLVWTREIPGGWEARVEARTRDGAIVGAAEAECLKIEKNWQDRDAYAVRSMAQTRATAKALRMPLGFVMTMAGYEPTPAEEMPQEPPKQAARPQPAPRQPPPVKTPPSPKPVTPTIATAATRAWMAQNLEPCMQEALQYFIEIGAILPTETIDDVPLRFIPISKVEMTKLISDITHFAIGGKVPGKPIIHEPPPVTDLPVEQSVPQTEGDYDLTQWPFTCIVPIPRKGMKRDDYLKNPDTIGSLFANRHETDEQGAADRQRLWGFIAHFEPKSWVDRQGQTRMPSKADLEFRKALDVLADLLKRKGDAL